MGRRQLEAEIEEGSWYVVPAEARDPISADPEGPVASGAEATGGRPRHRLGISRGSGDELSRAAAGRRAPACASTGVQAGPRAQLRLKGRSVIRPDSYHHAVEPGAGRPSVRRARQTDVAALTAGLVRAFADDPVANFMFPGHRRRRHGLHSFFSSQIRRQYLPGGHVYTTEDLAGTAVWGAPDRDRNGLIELLQLLPTAPYLLSTARSGPCASCSR